MGLSNQRGPSGQDISSFITAIGGQKEVKLTRLGPLVRVNIGNNKDVSLPAALYRRFRAPQRVVKLMRRTRNRLLQSPSSRCPTFPGRIGELSAASSCQVCMA